MTCHRASQLDTWWKLTAGTHQCLASEQHHTAAPRKLRNLGCVAMHFPKYVDDMIKIQINTHSPRTWIEPPYSHHFHANYDEALESVRKKIYCKPRNYTGPALVQIVNSTVLLERLGNKSEPTVVSYCAVVMFYTPWCPFCARVAPTYNALARAFPSLDVFAIDALTFSK